MERPLAASATLEELRAAAEESEDEAQEELRPSPATTVPLDADDSSAAAEAEAQAETEASADYGAEPETEAKPTPPRSTTASSLPQPRRLEESTPLVRQLEAAALGQMLGDGARVQLSRLLARLPLLEPDRRAKAFSLLV